MSDDVTPALLDEIERVARAATPGRWCVADDGRTIMGGPRCEYVAQVCGGIRHPSTMADRDHIVRMDPPTTLALVAHVRALEMRNAELRTALDSLVVDAYDAAAAEVEALRARVAELEARRPTLCPDCRGGARCPHCDDMDPRVTGPLEGPNQWSCCGAPWDKAQSWTCSTCGGSSAVLVEADPAKVESLRRALGSEAVQ
ncbi:MAG: hypothetical protein Q8Q14_11490 [Gemmatimonadales bacterium]|nr:hypothetical protein [Gemmatimonadales bacterium]